MEITLPSFVDYPDGAQLSWKSHRFYKHDIIYRFQSWLETEKFSVQINRHGAEAARGAHNSEVTRSKRVVGIHYVTSHRCIKALEQPNRHGAEAARGAHNSEVTRSKRVAGIFHITSHRCIKALVRGTYGSPLTPPFKNGQGVRGDSMSPQSNL